MHRLMALSIVTGSCLALSAVAQDYTLSVGAIHKRLGTVEFKGTDFANSALPGSAYVNGTAATGAAGTPLVVLNPALQVVGNQASLDQLSTPGGDDEFGGRTGMALSLGRTLTRANDWSLGWDVNGLWAGGELSNTSVATVTSTGYTVVLPAIVPPNIFTIALPAGAGTATTQGWLANRLKLDTYTVGTGLTAAGAWKRLSLIAGLGVSACIADAQASRTETVQWLDGTALYSRRNAETACRMIPGAYATVGLSYDVTRTILVGLEYRYDRFAQEMKTDAANVNLDGGTVQVKFGYRF